MSVIITGSNESCLVTSDTSVIHSRTFQGRDFEHIIYGFDVYDFGFLLFAGVKDEDKLVKNKIPLWNNVPLCYSSDLRLIKKLFNKLKDKIIGNNYTISIGRNFYNFKFDNDFEKLLKNNSVDPMSLRRTKIKTERVIEYLKSIKTSDFNHELLERIKILESIKTNFLTCRECAFMVDWSNADLHGLNYCCEHDYFESTPLRNINNYEISDLENICKYHTLINLQLPVDSLKNVIALDALDSNNKARLSKFIERT